MCTSSKKMGNKIFLFGIEIDYTHPTTLLFPVFIWVSAFDVAALSQSESALYIWNHIFDRKDLHSTFHHLGPPLISKFISNLRKFFLDNRKNFLRICQNILKF